MVLLVKWVGTLYDGGPGFTPSPPTPLLLGDRGFALTPGPSPGGRGEKMRRGPIAPSLAGGRVFTSMNRMDRMTGGVWVCHCDPVLDAGVGNLDEVAMVVHRRVLNLTGIAAWFDRLTMSGCAPHNDREVVGLCPHTSRRVRHPECYAAVGFVLVMGNGVQQPGQPHSNFRGPHILSFPRKRESI